MALIHSKQFNPRFTGSFTLSGSLAGSTKTTASFDYFTGSFHGDASGLSGVSDPSGITGSWRGWASSSGFSASIAASGFTGGTGTYNGSRRVLNTSLTGLFSASFNAGTSGSVGDFLDAVFFLIVVFDHIESTVIEIELIAGLFCLLSFLPQYLIKAKL